MYYEIYKFLELIALGGWMGGLEYSAQYTWSAKLGQKFCRFTDYRNAGK